MGRAAFKAANHILATTCYFYLPTIDETAFLGVNSFLVRGAQAEPAALLQEEKLEWDHIPNLDAFFMRLYTYFAEQGFW